MLSMMMVVMMGPTCHKNREDDYKKVNIANVIAKMAALDNEFPPSLILNELFSINNGFSQGETMSV